MSTPTTIPLYIIGGSREAARVELWARNIERTGLFRITFKWWDAARAWAGADWAGKDGLLTDAQQAEIAFACYTGLRASDLVWCLWPQGESDGARLELGYAFGHTWHAHGERRIVALSGPGCRTSAMTSPATFRHEADEAAFEMLCRVARELLDERLDQARAEQDALAMRLREDAGSAAE